MHDVGKPAEGDLRLDEDCGPAKRNRYFVKKRMKVEQFEVEQTYGIERRRLINRAVLGSGVVYGFVLDAPKKPCPEPPPEPPPQPTGAYPEGEPEALTDPEESYDGDQPPEQPDGDDDTYEPAAAPAEAARAPEPTPEPTPAPEPFELKIGEGFALDAHGREVLLTHGVTLTADNTFLLVKTTTGPRFMPIDKAKPGPHLLSVHYAERPTGPVVTTQVCGCAQAEASYVCEGVVFSLSPLDCNDCPCGEPRRPGGCDCVDDDSCCGSGRGPHGRLCEWTAAVPEGGEDTLASWKGRAVAIADGVALACLTLEDGCDPCRPLSVRSVDDACGPRQIVKNNSLLYDLIRGCDLTRIKAISWDVWRDPEYEGVVPWDAFEKLFGSDGETNFTVTFSRPVKVASLDRLGVFTMTVIMREDQGWRQVMRVPVEQLDTTPSTPMAADYTDQFRVIVDSGWFGDEFNPKTGSRFDRGRFVVEIETRGDLIEDCNGQQVDANTPGDEDVPSGNGTPGGCHFTTFCVAPKAKPPPQEPYGRRGRQTIG